MEISEQIINLLHSMPFSEQVKVAAELKSHGILLNVYKNPTPVAVAVIPIMTSCGLAYLGIIRGHAPEVGGLAFPGGFVDTMETAERAAKREVLEEIGLDLDETKFKVMCTRMSMHNNLQIFCRYTDVLTESVLAKLNVNATEVRGVVLIYRDSSMCFPTHAEILHHIL